jgi:predicted ArsR family transcriptional regulator
MFVSGISDLAKPQWIAAIREMKLAGGLPASELSRLLGVSYMSAKQYCEDLRKLGYVERSRVPRTEVGRPEIFYRLSAKADALFPAAGAGFPLQLLETVRTLFGESAPERLLFAHFQQQQERWQPLVDGAQGISGRLAQLAALREKEGCVVRCVELPDGPLRMEEFHHPLREIFLRFPRSVVTELRMLESLLHARIRRHEIPGGKSGPARVDYEVVDSAQAS